MPSYYVYHCTNPECDYEAYRYRNHKICPKCKSPVEREEALDFRAACIICGARCNLEMFAHRNEKQQMVGWIFACAKCGPRVADQDLIIEFKKDT